MPTSNEFHQVKISKIKVPKTRQRANEKHLKGNEEYINSLATSIRTIGLLHPIIVTRKNVLVAGKCRLEAVQLLDIKTIPVHYIDEIDASELTAIELEENIKRRDLHWKDECLAHLTYHEHCQSIKEGWLVQDTANAIGSKKTNVSYYLTIARKLLDGDERVHAADGVSAAYNVIKRARSREIDSELEDIPDLVSDLHLDEPIVEGDTPTTPPKPTHRHKAEEDLHVVDFVAAVSKFRAKKFNFLHCDFPYGIHHDKSPMGGAATWGGYPDSPETYRKLLAALFEHHDKFLTKSAHIMFWFSMTYYQETLDGFNSLPGFVCNPFPLIWHKSDNKGILPDPERGPRRTYETAFIITRGDRRVVSPIANSYSAPTSKAEAIHVSQKPEPVLRHFFRLFVDENTEMLDPTCGSGTALMSAEDCHAKRVQGWDMDKEYIEFATTALNQHRVLRSMP